jgi:hypothetical protein
MVIESIARRKLAQANAAKAQPIKHWSLTSLKEKPIKIGAKTVSHGRYVALRMAGVATSRILFGNTPG